MNQVMIKVQGEVSELSTPGFVYSIQLTSLSINADTFTWWNTFTGDIIQVPYFITGNINKILTVILKGDDYYQQYETPLGLAVYADTPYIFNIPAPQNDGVYEIEAFVSNVENTLSTQSLKINWGGLHKTICAQSPFH